LVLPNVRDRPPTSRHTRQPLARVDRREGRPDAGRLDYGRQHCCAFAAAFAAAVIAGIVVRHDGAARRAEQASRVAAWIEFRESSGSWGHRGYACVFLSTSPLPVYDVAVGYLYYDAAGRAWDAGSDMLPLESVSKICL
jgi:hypothetical protein